MLICLWLTSNCNLRCTYCYEKDKKNYVDMDKDTINRILEFIEEKMEKDKYLIISFHGGEPLLRFDLISYFIDKLDKLRAERQIDVSYNMTTNGTMLSREIVDFIKEKGISISISMDGLPEIHNENRRTADGRGSLELIEKNLDYLLKNLGDVIARMTYTHETVESLAKGIKYLIALGFKKVKPAPDFYDGLWADEHMEVLKKQLQSAIEFANNRDTRVILPKVNYSTNKCGKCSGGINQFYISANGDVYPCNAVVGDEEFVMGNINDYKALNAPKHLYKYYEFESCKGCTFFHYCDTSRCIYVNYKASGREDEPTGFFCAYQQLIKDMA